MLIISNKTLNSFAETSKKSQFSEIIDQLSTNYGYIRNIPENNKINCAKQILADIQRLKLTKLGLVKNYVEAAFLFGLDFVSDSYLSHIGIIVQDEKDESKAEKFLKYRLEDYYYNVSGEDSSILRKAVNRFDFCKNQFETSNKDPQSMSNILFELYPEKYDFVTPQRINDTLTSIVALGRLKTPGIMMADFLFGINVSNNPLWEYRTNYYLPKEVFV